MLLFPIIALGAVILGYTTGGRLRGFEHLHLRWWGLALAGLALQGAPLPSWNGATEQGLAAVALVASYVLLLSFVALNRRMPAFFLLFLGLAFNMAVIAANGGMPVSREALERSGQVGALAVLETDGGVKHHLLEPGEALTPLADVIPIGPPVRAVVSFGDLLVYGAGMWLILTAMRGKAPAPAPTGYWGKHRPRWMLPEWARPAPLGSRPVSLRPAEAARSGT